ncbi:MAG: preprotein translocase subunit YajC [Acidobacteriota bacterium]|nr:preprotein translocase subunit YajC [Thermoanaerobaculaceae bacterium]
MLSFLLMAETQGQNQNPIMAFLPLILLIVIFYFMLIRPQQKRAKEHRMMLSELKAGDKVFTVGGIRGTVVAVDDLKIVLRVSDNTKISFNKSAVAGRLPETEEI